MWIAALIGGSVLLLLAVELVTRAGFHRISRIRHRIETQYRGAVSVGQVPERPAILVLGNSLLLLGIDFGALDSALPPDVRVQPFLVEDTGYNDWYFALRRLFAMGSRPTLVVLGLSSRQLIAEKMPGDYAVHQLVGWGDVWKVAKHADRTAASNLVFARLSLFYGARAEIRKWLLNRLVSGLPGLGDKMRRPSPPLPSDEEIARLSTPHLVALRDLCSQYGAQLVIVVPPTASEDGVAGVERAGEVAGVRVLVPLRVSQLDASQFAADRFHLNADGAKLFTRAFAAALATTTQTTRGMAPSAALPKQ